MYLPKVYTIYADIQFLILLAMVIVHIQCLLRVDGSILAGVLTSFFCVVPESPYSSDAASSSLLVAWYLNCISAASTRSTVASETGGCSAPDPYAVVSNQFGLQLLTVKLLL